MHVTLYLSIMLTLSTIIAALSLLLVLLERRPHRRHTAAMQPPGLHQPSPGTTGRARIRLAVQRAIRGQWGEARRRLDSRRTIILGGLPLGDDAEDEHDQGREVSQGWEPAVPTAAASGPTSG